MDHIIELPEWRARVQVFGDRADAGAVLAGMLESLAGSDALLLAIPAGGVPVAAAIAKQLKLALDVAVVSKITLPWNTEAGYGAVGFDGTVRLNAELLSHLGLTDRKSLRELRGPDARLQAASRCCAARGLYPYSPDGPWSW
jgi:putative phosphoribosyl transferase